MKTFGIIFLIIGLFILVAGFVEIKKIEANKINYEECMLEDIKNRTRMEYINPAYSSYIPSTYAIKIMAKRYKKEKTEQVIILGGMLTFISLMVLVVYKAKKLNEI